MLSLKKTFNRPDPIVSLSWNANDLLISLSESKVVQLHQPDGSRELSHLKGASNVTFSPKWCDIAIVTRDGVERVCISRHGGRSLFGINGGQVSNIVFSPDGKYFALGTSKGILLFDPKTWRYLRRLERHTDRICSICFSADGKQIASIGWDGLVLLWDLESGTEKTIEQIDPVWKNPGPIIYDHYYGACLSTDGKYLAAIFDNCDVDVWDLVDNTKFSLGCGSGLTSIAFIHGTHELVLACIDEPFSIWDLDTRKMVRRVTGKCARSVASHPTEPKIALGFNDGSIEIWPRPPTNVKDE